MHSACHEAAAAVAGYADRRRFARVEYRHDASHGYCESFPWYDFEALLREKLDYIGVEYVASREAATETPGPLAKE